MIIYFDTETTGLYPGSICQLSYVLQDKDRITGKNFFFSVEYVEYGAFQVHGFSVDVLEKLSGGKEFCHYIDEIEKDFSSADMIVSHNISFDCCFMRKEFERCGRFFTYNKDFCSMKRMTPVCKLLRSDGISYKYPKLTELYSFFGFNDFDVASETARLFDCKVKSHDARFDSTAVFLSLNRGMEDDNVALLQGLKDCL